ncbi:hypothetical protein HKX54_10005 [Sulfitobacter sp. M57]|uniref:Hint domain-containing protein n=1 Tax=unclassified Sulfitobacter TaxID=196795 RepID=UPI0023E102B7|nr:MULTISPECIES: Hint domain-containing protein [unclassified Sulfitobacter]MDF3414786.1 hypothetical protein [Sulfitobacter sp. KE5]MDF3422267.1 hypothetical protein [Sulfitobacter sp. KE43]MDF3433332.1 hypothetical protein [Sulfitobacter sp. KE42]MDF3458972.1 hypothetical protein [Sulfitobacter sp. S74]MDF3462871.1 hypothetical protein [Sulfitobacter sp. Ks18]
MAILDNAVWINSGSGYAENGSTVISEGANSTTVNASFTANGWDTTANNTGVSSFGAAFITEPINANYAFTNPVEDLSFTLEHVSSSGTTYDDQFTLAIYDENGVLIPAADIIAGLTGVTDVTVSTDANGFVVIEADNSTPENIGINITGHKVSVLDVTFEVGPDGTQTGGAGLSDFSFTVPVAPDYIVEGTGGDDLIDGAYVDDPEGDRVDDNDNAAGNNNDSIEAGAGDDTINAGAGDDTILAGDGDDRIIDSAGDDLAQGGEGRDSFEYTTITGDDTVVGGELNDTTATNSGDKLDARQSVDDLTVVFTGNEAGTMTDGTGTVTFSEIENIRGGQGDDVINADASNIQQILDGGEGADTITGGGGNDIISMGRTQDQSATDGENDTLVLNNSFGNDLIENFEVPTDLGGGTYAGNDRVDVTALTDGSGVPVTTDVVVVSDTNGDGTGDAILTFPNGESITLRGVNVSEISSEAQLAAIGIPQPAVLDYIVEGTEAGELINAGYGGDPDGDQVDNNDHSDGSNDDSIHAGGGDDTVSAGVGDDTVDAGTGDDIVYAETGDDNVSGGAGDDSLFGESGADTLLGGEGADSLDGGTGNDQLTGGVGNDTLWGQDGNDTLDGGDGDDFLNGGYEDDLIRGGDGNDWLEGWYGNDTIEGGAGNDFIDADNDSDLVYAGDGDDTVVGGYSISSDTIYGGAGNDSLDGQGGDDLIYGGTGNDQLFGSGDDDTFFLEDNFGADTIDGSNLDEDVGDTLDLSLVTTATTVDLRDANAESGTVSDGTDTANFMEIENIVLGGGRDTIVLADGSGADRVQAFDLTDSGDGSTNDQLDVSSMTSDGGTTPVTTDDVVVSDTNGDGTGDAILTFPGGESITLVGVLASQVDSTAELESIGIPAPVVGPDYIVEGTSGDDMIGTGYVGDPEGDRVDANDNATGTNADRIEAGDGDDTVQAGLDNDTVYAGDGSDVIYGGDGDDVVFGGADRDLIYGGAGADTLDGGAGNDFISGADGDDSLIGGAGNDDFNAGDGNDTVLGGADNDNISGDAGDDSLGGGTGDDSIWGGDGSDTISGGDGVDAIYGGSGDDNIDGGSGGDYIQLTGGDDTVLAGEDADLIDIIAPDYADGAVVTVDGDTTGVDSDTLRLNGWSGFRNLVQTTDADGDSTSGSVELVNDDGNWVTVNFSEIESLVLPATDLTPDHIVEGTAGNDTIDTDYVGDPEGDRIDNLDHSDGSNDDSIQGFGGDDLIEAGAGDDTIDGGTGNDTIIGFEGNDSVFGGEGDDDINTRTSVGTGRPDEGYFDASNPVLNYDADTDPNNDRDTVDGGDGNDRIRTGDDDDVIIAGTGADTVDGGFDDDSISGGAGVDSLEGNEGNDTISGGADGDLIYGDVSPDSPDYPYYTPYDLANDGSDQAPANNADLLSGDGGDDTIYGQDDDDTISGGAGDDLLDGGGDDDVITGGAGSDTIIGGSGNDTIDGGDGDDSLTGGEGNDVFTYGGGNDTISDLNFGATGTLDDGDDSNNDFVDLSGYYDHISELYADQADDGILNQSNTADYSDNTQFGSGSLVLQGVTADSSGLTRENTGVVCFTAGTNILTQAGYRPIETLEIGDMVLTEDNGFQPIKWIGQRRVSGNGRLAPIYLEKGVLNGAKRPLLVSPQHRVLLAGYEAELFFGEPEVLIPAKFLVNGTTVRQQYCDAVTYIHIMFEQHEIVYADGQASESFYANDTGLDVLSEESREELFAIFPELRWNSGAHGDTVRNCLKAREAAIFKATARGVSSG